MEVLREGKQVAWMLGGVCHYPASHNKTYLRATMGGSIDPSPNKSSPLWRENTLPLHSLRR